jgi:hypothetical protein
MILALGQNLVTGAMSGDIFGCHNWDGAVGIQWVEVRGDGTYFSLHRTARNNKELFST